MSSAQVQFQLFRHARRAGIAVPNPVASLGSIGAHIDLAGPVALSALPQGAFVFRKMGTRSDLHPVQRCVSSPLVHGLCALRPCSQSTTDEAAGVQILSSEIASRFARGANGYG